MNIAELMYDLRKWKNEDGDMPLFLHVDDGSEDYVVATCSRIYDEKGRAKFAVMAIKKRSDVISMSPNEMGESIAKEVMEHGAYS